MTATTFTVNDRSYAHPGVPVVVICIDGSEPDYHQKAVEAGRTPWLAEVLASGRGSSWEGQLVGQWVRGVRVVGGGEIAAVERRGGHNPVRVVPGRDQRLVIRKERSAPDL
jgi:hypothetical protein